MKGSKAKMMLEVRIGKVYITNLMLDVGISVLW